MEHLQAVSDCHMERRESQKAVADVIWRRLEVGDRAAEDTRRKCREQLLGTLRIRSVGSGNGVAGFEELPARQIRQLRRELPTKQTRTKFAQPVGATLVRTSLLDFAVLWMMECKFVCCSCLKIYGRTRPGLRN